MSKSTPALSPGQLWSPPTAPARQIVEHRAAGIFDPYRMGELIVVWATNVARQGMCSERAFKRWIKHHGAKLS